MNPWIPQLTRREWLRVGGATVVGHSLLPTLRPHNAMAAETVKPRATAETCIFIDLMGGPSQLDTFDIKEGAWTPEDFDVQTTKQGTRMPVGLLPKLSERIDQYAIVRSMNFFENAHVRGTYYLQAGRIQSPARLGEIPSVGSVVAYESLANRKDDHFLPPFVSMNMDPFQLVGSGLLGATSSPLLVGQTQTIGNRLRAMDTSLPLLVSDAERPEFERRRDLLQRLRQEWHGGGEQTPRIFQDIDDYYHSAWRIMEDSRAADVFAIPATDHDRYGASGVGDACAVARNLVSADAGTRFIFIAQDGWDLHGNAYEGNDFFVDGKLVKGGWNQYQMCWDLDAALSTLLDDLAQSKDASGKPLLEKTLVVVMGEFGRIGGPLDGLKGRGHNEHAGVAVLAGAGVQGGVVLGATDALGGKVATHGWHKDRPVYPEDILATIYSSLGIDWTKEILATPSGRPFQYVENTSPRGTIDFGEISELFG